MGMEFMIMKPVLNESQLSFAALLTWLAFPQETIRGESSNQNGKIQFVAIPAFSVELYMLIHNNEALTFAGGCFICICMKHINAKLKSKSSYILSTGSLSYLSWRL